MVRLIHLLFLLLCALPTAAEIDHRDILERRDVFGALQQDIALNYMVDGKPLPESLDEFEFVREIAGVTSGKLNPHGIKGINGFVVVPGLPEIMTDPEIPRELIGARLYIVNRHPNHDNSPPDADPSDPLTGGRHAIFVAGAEPRVEVAWMRERVFQRIFGHLGGFRPEDQPPVFVEEAAQVGLSAQDLMTPVTIERSADAGPDSRWPSGAVLNWIVGGLIATIGLSLLLWLKFRKAV